MVFLIFLSDQLRLRVQSILIDSFPVQFLQEFELFSVEALVSWALTVTHGSVHGRLMASESESTSSSTSL